MFEANREGEVAAPAHNYGQVGESTEQSQPKQDQVRPGTRLGQVGTGTSHSLDIEATREGEGEEATYIYEQVEENKELTLPKLDQVDQVG